MRDRWRPVVGKVAGPTATVTCIRCSKQVELKAEHVGEPLLGRCPGCLYWYKLEAEGKL